MSFSFCCLFYYMKCAVFLYLLLATVIPIHILTTFLKLLATCQIYARKVTILSKFLLLSGISKQGMWMGRPLQVVYIPSQVLYSYSLRASSLLCCFINVHILYDKWQ